MTGAERAELGKLLRLRGTVAKADLKARGAEQAAIVEQQLSARFSAEDVKFADVTALGKQACKKVDAEVAARCEALGIPASFRPSASFAWSYRGENAIRERRTELRMVARAEIEAGVKRGSVEIDRAVAALQTRLIDGALSSADARLFLDALPTVESLLPAPSVAAIESASPSRVRLAAIGRANDDDEAAP